MRKTKSKRNKKIRKHPNKEMSTLGFKIHTFRNQQSTIRKKKFRVRQENSQA